MMYPYCLPEKLMMICVMGDRFYVVNEEVKMNRTYFLSYLHCLIEHGSDNLHEQLIQAAALQNMDKILALTPELNATDSPHLIHIIRSLLKPKTLTINHNNLLAELFSAPLKIHEKTISQHIIHDLIKAYPNHADSLLTQAMLNESPVDWPFIFQSETHAEYACLALAHRAKEVSQTLKGLYNSNRTFSRLMAWMLIDTQGAMTALPDHPNTEDIFKILSLHGDPKTFSEHADKLITIRTDDVRDAINLMFNQQVFTRKGMSTDLGVQVFSYDPIHAKQLCEKMKSGRTVESIKHNGQGSALLYYTLREKLHEHH